MKFVSTCSKVFILLGMCSSIAMTNSCRKKGSSSTKAIVSKDGKNAIGLLPMRHFYSNTLKLTPGSAFQVQDALRLKYAAVHCKGDGAARVFNSLEDISRYTVLHLKHDKDQVMISQASVTDAMSGLAAANDKDGLDRFMDVKDKYFSIDSNGYYRIAKGTENPCSILGDHALSGGSFVKLMADADTDFESKQILWLAARGRYTKNTSQAFSPAFYTFLRENIGAIPRAAIGQSIPRFQEIDKEFNPCAVESKKNGVFSCDNAGNYEIADEIFNKKLERLLEIAKSANESYLKALQTAGASGKASSAGLQVAVTIKSTISDSGLVVEADGAPAAGNAPAPSSDEATKIHPAIATMFPKLASIQEYFDVNFELNQGQVLDMSNPVKILVGGAATSQERRLGLSDDQSGFGLGGPVGAGIAAASKSSSTSSSAPKTNGSMGSSGASSSAGMSTKPQASNMSMSQPIPPKAVPVQKTNIVPATSLNVGKVNNGDFWTRDASDPNLFRHKDPVTGIEMISKAVQEKGSLVYHNHHQDQNGNTIPGSKYLMFPNTDLAGGAGKNTFVYYKRKEGDTNADGTVNKDAYSKDDGKIYSQTSEDQKGGWLDFSRSPDEQRSRQLAGATKDDNAFIFKPENADPSFTPMLLKKETGPNKKADFSWIIPPKSEQPPQMQDAFQSNNQASSAQSPNSQTADHTGAEPGSNSPETLSTDEKRPYNSASGDTKMPVLNDVDLMPAAPRNAADIAAKSASLFKEHLKLQEKSGKLDVYTTDRLDKAKKQFSELEEVAKRSKDVKEIQKAMSDALNRERWLLDSYISSEQIAAEEVPGSSKQKKASPAAQKSIDAQKEALKNTIALQEEVKQQMDLGKFNQREMLKKELQVLQPKREAAKAKRELFKEKNGPQYELKEGMERPIERYTEKQREEIDSLKRLVGAYDEYIAAKEKELQILEGGTNSTIPIHSNN